MTKKDKEKQQKELEDKILKGLKLTYKRLLQFKKEKNTELVVIREGKIVHIKPE